MKTRHKLIRISKHALLRCQERFNYDVEEARRFLTRIINSPRMKSVIEMAGPCPFKIKNADGIFCVRGGTLTTCYPSK